MMMGKELCEQYTPMEKNVKAVRILSGQAVDIYGEFISFQNSEKIVKK